MVGEVVAGEGIDEIDVARDVRDRNRDDLAITRRCCDRAGAREQVGGIPCEQCGCDNGRHVVTRLGPLDDLGDRGWVADHELMDHVVGFVGHVSSIRAYPDTGLTRQIGHTLPSCSRCPCSMWWRSTATVSVSPCGAARQPKCSSAWHSRPA